MLASGQASSQSWQQLHLRVTSRRYGWRTFMRSDRDGQLQLQLICSLLQHPYHMCS